MTALCPIKRGRWLTDHFCANFGRQNPGARLEPIAGEYPSATYNFEWLVLF
jgi:hypothetical protein